MDPPLDWDGTIQPASKRGTLHDALDSIPRARWSERCPRSGFTLLHCACSGNNVTATVALLAHGVISVDDHATIDRWSPALVAAHWRQPRVLEMLCAAGANLLLRNAAGVSPLDLALEAGNDACARVLLLNGVRLATAGASVAVGPWLVALERGVLRCRAAVVALLRARTPGWLAHEMALACWTTRAAPAWQPESVREPDLDWVAIATSADHDQLLHYLRLHVPRARWRQRNAVGGTLLHYACRSASSGAAVALLAHGLDVNCEQRYGTRPLHAAVFYSQPRVLEVLCAAGADLNAREHQSWTALDRALAGRSFPCVRVLLANGARLATVAACYGERIEPWMVALERGVASCRLCIVALLLSLRPLRPAHAHLARAVWVTRTDVAWQGQEHGCVIG